MSNQLSAGEKAVITVFVAVLAMGTGGMVFLGSAMLEVQRDLGEFRAEFAGFRVEVLERLDRVEERLDRVEERLDRLEERVTAIEAVIHTHHGVPPRPAN